MSETLIIEVDEQATSIQAMWLLAGGAVRSVSMEDVATVGPATKIVAVLDGRAVAAQVVEMPAVDDARALKILPAVLDDRISVAETQNHLALLGDRNNETGTCVAAVVERALMEKLLQLLATHHLKATVVVPDYMLLPLPEDELIQLDRGDRKLVRLPDGGGYAVDETGSALMAELHTPADIKLTWQDLLAVAADTSVNLLQGAFVPRTGIRTTVLWWRRAAVMALVTLVVIASTIWFEAAENYRKADQYYAGAELVFRQALPNEPRIVNMDAQLRRALAGKRQQGGGEFFYLSGFVISAIESSEQTLLETMRYDQERGELSLDVSFASFADSTSFKQALEQAGVSVTEGSSRQEGERVFSELRVRRQ